MSRCLPDLPLIARRRRLAALAVSVTCAAGMVALGMRLHGTSTPDVVDSLVGPALLVASPTAREALWAVVFLGDPVLVAVGAGVLALVAALTGRWAAAAVALAGPAASAALTEFVLKPGFERTKTEDLAYPSGHTVTATSLAVVVVILVGSTKRPRSVRLRSLIRAVAVSAPVAVGVALVALDLHYVTDVVGGALTAVAVLLATAAAVDAVVDAVSMRCSSGNAAAPSDDSGPEGVRRGDPAPPAC